MKIFIPRVQGSTTKHQLCQFVQDILDKKLRLPFAEPPHLMECEIITIKDRNGIKDYHGLVTITPGSAGEWFIKKSRHQTLNGRRIFAREYKERSNDPSVSVTEERRRSDLEVETVKEQKVAVEGLTQFSKEYK